MPLFFRIACWNFARWGTTTSVRRFIGIARIGLISVAMSATADFPCARFPARFVCWSTRKRFSGGSRRRGNKICFCRAKTSSLRSARRFPNSIFMCQSSCRPWTSLSDGISAMPLIGCRHGCHSDAMDGIRMIIVFGNRSSKDWGMNCQNQKQARAFLESDVGYIAVF